MLETPVSISVETTIKASVADCWNTWTNVPDILQFNNPFHDWHTTAARIDLKKDGRLYYRMEKKDGSSGFDFEGVYDRIIPNELIESTGSDGRKTITRFSKVSDGTLVTETFEPETTTPIEIQRGFCQTILDSFKKYMERQR